MKARKSTQSVKEENDRQTDRQTGKKAQATTDLGGAKHNVKRRLDLGLDRGPELLHLLLANGAGVAEPPPVRLDARRMGDVARDEKTVQHLRIAVAASAGFKASERERAERSM